MMMAFIVLVPIYSFFFLIGFKPFGLPELLDDTIGRFAFMAAIIAAIQLVTNLICRLIMLLLKEGLSRSYSKFVLMEVVELVANTMFITLFVWLATGRQVPYFSMMPEVFIYALPILMFPYVILSLIAELQDRIERIENLDDTITKYSSGQIGADDSPVHFLDSSGNLKLMVRADSIFYVEAADNYVNICYVQSGKLTRYSLRNTMTGIEEICLANNLARCHRSYFVNLRKVKILQRDKDGVFAELDFQGAPRIPVSKTYSKQVVERFSALND